MKQPSLFDLSPASSPQAVNPPPDQAAREFAIDPQNDVVLEASAGTGKTRVLVDRYVRLIQAGVDPRHILAITFTRKAAAEMRERVLEALRKRAMQGDLPPARWRELRQRIADIQISTIDAFCFSLLREFPLEAGVEPGFDIADETEMGRFGREAMARAIRIARATFAKDESLRLLFTRVKTPVLSRAVGELLDRRQVAVPAVRSFVARQPQASSTGIADAFVARLRELVEPSSVRAGLIDGGPHGSPEFDWLRAELTALPTFSGTTDLTRVQSLRRRLERYFLTKAGEPRKKAPDAFRADQRTKFPRNRAHDEAVATLAPLIHDALGALESAVGVLLARGLQTLLSIAVHQYETLLEEHGVLDFAAMLDKSVELLSHQEEFAQSRLKLQARYHHVLVDEFQDTSRQQWRLVSLLVDAWGEGAGVADAPTSIFVVGDRKQSIYRFRHAEVTLLDEAARKISALRGNRPVRKAITASFRAVPELLAFVNALSEAVQTGADLPDRFTYTDRDRFPAPDVAPGALRDGVPVLGLIAESSIALCASAAAAEIERIIGRVLVRDKDGPPRPARPDDVAILFRTRAGHQFFEAALEARNIQTYVYKGLGFFDAPEVQDLQALLRVLSKPGSDLRAAEFLRSRFVRVSDIGLTRLAPSFAAALSASPPAPRLPLDARDQSLLDRARAGLQRWLALADHVPPSELLDTVLRESAVMFEMRGRRLSQARENVKKVRALVRRVESRGYATLGRIAEYFETLRAGEESNAILEAAGCVNLMTIHAAKGLEFPIVFLVNLQASVRGRTGTFSVIEHGPDGESAVAFSSNDATRLEDLREAEEVRRLLYVGVTRARDRLYLASEVDTRGQLRRPARSLASLLPAPLAALCAEAATESSRDAVTWMTSAGSFTFGVCRPSDAPPLIQLMPPVGARDGAPFDVGLLEQARPSPVAVSDLEVDIERGQPAATTSASSDRLTGTIVHRLFQRQIDPGLDARGRSRLLPFLVSDDEVIDTADPEQVVAQAFELYRALRQRPDVDALLKSGTCHYEVPFSFVAESRPQHLIRGVVDCLIVANAGAPTIVEFKTGRPRPEHHAQAEWYRAAIQAAFRVDRVDLKILYA